MKTAFTTYSTPAWDIERIVAAAVLYGYQGLEFRMLAGQPLAPDIPADRRRRIKHLCDSNGLDICVVGSGCRFSSSDPAERSKNVEQLRGFIDLAVEWEAPVVRIFGGVHPEVCRGISVSEGSSPSARNDTGIRTRVSGSMRPARRRPSGSEATSSPAKRGRGPVLARDSVTCLR